MTIIEIFVTGSAILGGMAAALYLFLYVSDKWRTQANKAPTITFVGFLLATILIVTLPRAIDIGGIGLRSGLTKYAVSVFVYKDSLGMGRQYVTGDTQQPDVEVVVHDAYHQKLSEMTDKGGKAVITMRTPGDISVDVCGISQTHHLSDKHNIINPYTIKVGVQKFERCKRSH